MTTKRFTLDRATVQRFATDDTFRRVGTSKAQRVHLRSLAYRNSLGSCSVCGKDLDMVGCSTDLIVPEENGGTLCWQNLHAVHSYCTREYRDRKYGVQAAAHEGIV